MKLNKKVSDFVDKHRVSVLTTLLDNGDPYSATMHYASTHNPLAFLFLTEKESRKCKHFNKGKKYPASLVIGFSEEEWEELQLEGEIYLINEEKELEKAWKTYAGKFVGMDKWKDSKDDVLLKFIPSWYRFSEFKPKFEKIESK